MSGSKHEPPTSTTAPEPPQAPGPDHRCESCNWFEDGNFCGMYRQDVTAGDGADCGLWADPEDCDDDE